VVFALKDFPIKGRLEIKAFVRIFIASIFLFIWSSLYNEETVK